MIKKTLIGVCGLAFVAAFISPAFADQSIGYQKYFNEGVKAFKDHDDQKALRCFRIAQIYDPSDEENNGYISILEKRAVTLEQAQTPLPPEESVGYKYYLAKGIEAFRKQDDQKATYYFNIAIIFYPDSKEVDEYLQKLGQIVPQVIPQAQLIPPTLPQPPAVESQAVTQTQPYSSAAPVQQIAVVPRAQLIPSTLPQPPPAVESQAVPQPPASNSQGAIYIGLPKAKMPIPEISLSQISNNSQVNPKLQIELNSSVIIVGKNIQRFLVVQEGVIGVKAIGTDRLEIDALSIGTTFLHIWDDLGRHSLYVGVVFPKIVNPNGSPQEMNGVQHSRPFTVTYSNDWDTYYSGKNIPDLKRQSYQLNQSLAVNGETPYGFFDTSASYTDYDSISNFDTYTIGLRQIPLDGTSNFNLRGFDARRYLSPLTLPGTTMRGVFADVDLLEDNLGLSLSEGQEQVPVGFLSAGQNQFNNSYIDAAKLTLFPKSNQDQYSFNFATSYGSDRQQYLSDHVYSVQGLHKFNDYLTLNAEEGFDTSHDASLASLNWQKGNFKSGLDFRNIDKNYSTISTLPAYQGETGASWMTEGDYQQFTENTFVETYRDRLDSNPDDPNAYNYDANGQLRANFTQNLWSDTDFNFVDTPGELSPLRSFGLNERLSRSFGIWNSLKGVVFAGPGYQNSHSSGSNISDYNREDVIAGVQLPLTKEVSSFANYEYDWLNEPYSGGNSNPSVINAGLEYQKSLTPKLAFNSQVSYHDELGVKPGDTTFLSGEESVIISSGFNYNPTPDLNFFADGDVSKVLSHIGNPSYDDFEVHIGMKITFGGATYWDPLGTVSGIVFKDRNGNGQFGPGDEGIPGVKVKIGDKEAVTNKDGRYRLQVRAKGVDVVPVLDTIPGGLIFSTPQSLNVQIIQGHTSRADFGLLSQTGIYGIVFVDKKGTGTPAEGDQFIGKVKIILDGKEIQKSDTQGTFYFRQISPGEHIITIDISTLALNMVPLVKLKNKIDVAEGTNYMFNIPVEIKQAVEEQN